MALGAAATTAVLTGALLVGDSLRGSLRELTLDRLGKIDYSLVGPGFFREDLASDLVKSTPFGTCSPAILLSSSTFHTETRARASRVNVHGIDERFLKVFNPDLGQSPLQLVGDKTRRFFPPLVINTSLQRELKARVGDEILISLEKQSDIHREFLWGRRDSSDILKSVRLTLTQVIPDQGLGRFSLLPHQHLPLNAYLSLRVLQKALGQEGRVNALLVAQRASGTDMSLGQWQQGLREILRLEDLGLKLRKSEDYFSLESQELILPPMIEEAATAVASQLGAPFLPILTYLATSLAGPQRTIPYSTITALNLDPSGPFTSLELTSGVAASSLGEKEILLNEWAASDLMVQSNEPIDVSYYVVGPGHQLLTRRSRFQLKGVVALKGLGADRALTPAIPGVQEIKDMSKWDPPFPIDLERIRPRDEAYWDEFEATPKAFVSQEVGLRLWGNRFGRQTSIRFAAVKGRSLQDTLERFHEHLLKRIDPAQLGWRFQGVREEGLAASVGTTDFGVLFTAFSFFLIISTVLLVGLLFRLGIEGRQREVGILLATGYPWRAVRQRFLIEGIIVAGGGSVLGLVAAAAYGWLLVVGLRTWWSAAVGTPFLSLYIGGSSLLAGYVISVAAILFTIWWTLRTLSRLPTLCVLTGLSGYLEEKVDGRRKTRFRLLVFGTLGLASLLTSIAILTEATSSVGLFFGIGICWLVCGLILFSLWLRTSHGSLLQSKGVRLYTRMATRNSARNPGRSLLSTALVASASFVIVAIGANRPGSDIEAVGKGSGTGGFSLVAQSDIPVHTDLNRPEGRFELGFSQAEADPLAEAQVFALRLLPGEDVSCLNLYQPQKPRLLGVSSKMIRRGGFEFQQVSSKRDNPWTLLQQRLEPGVVPVFGDANSVQWVLHLGLGQDLVFQDEKGEAIKLRLVGLLKNSIFQSELLISEENFLKHFPKRSGYAYFLIESPPQSTQKIAQDLESQLSHYGLDVISTTEKLAGYRAVEETYLSTFQTLGGLGLLLGTVGLGIVLVRNVLERRGELAVLRAFGFRRASLAWVVLAENALNLVFGLTVGAVSALIAVTPHLIGSNALVPWISLSLTLLGVLTVGLAAGAAAVFKTLRIPLLPTLKEE